VREKVPTKRKTMNEMKIIKYIEIKRARGKESKRMREEENKRYMKDCSV
jgi:hypothetical protein